MKKEEIIKEIEEVISVWQEWQSKLATGTDPDQHEIYRINTLLVQTIERFSTPGSSFRRTLVTLLGTFSIADKYLVRNSIDSIAGILLSLKHAYERNYLFEITELLNADLFTDFLNMAEYLLQSKYKDPAAVIIGSVLEIHIRKLAQNNPPIAITKPDGSFIKVEQLNADLRAEGVYNLTQQKSITAYLGIRNNAAHGDYTKYDENQVKLMHDGVRDFIAKYPA